MWVAKVMVVAACGLVPLRVVQGAFFVLDNVTWGARCDGGIALVVLGVEMVLLGHLSRQRVVVRQGRSIADVMLRRSVLHKRKDN